ncbi:MAG TPA: hypothetical protein VNT60_01860 [Deinococcales bacterium]|nr:hypothetical protein [Deinococcales bacterium]
MTTANSHDWINAEITRLESRLERIREDTEAAAWAARVVEVWIEQYASQVLEGQPEQYLRVRNATREVADVMGGQLRLRAAEQREIKDRLHALRAESDKSRNN